LQEDRLRYEKGRKDATRQRIMDVASERFRTDGIAASGLAGIMNEAGLTNGAFYPHFKSKSELVRESLAAAMDDQSSLIREIVADRGIEGAIAAYLSPEHRDNPGTGCTLAALLPELAREPLETRRVHAEHFSATAREMGSALPPNTEDPESVAVAIHATLIGTLQLARAVAGTDLSERVLEAGAAAARTLARSGLALQD
jgi:AcrR family transcriptional regulator